jgi:hypothetical protein
VPVNLVFCPFSTTPTLEFCPCSDWCVRDALINPDGVPPRAQFLLLGLQCGSAVMILKALLLLAVVHLACVSGSSGDRLSEFIQCKTDW